MASTLRLRLLPRLSTTSRQRCFPLNTSRKACYVRFQSSFSSEDDKEEDLPTSVKPELPSITSLPDATLRGVGQVIFLNSTTSGLAVLGGLAIGNPYLAVLAATGAATATTAAHFSGLDKAALQDGLFGYNGCLVGCAAAVFINPLPAASLLSPIALNAATAGMTTTILGSAATPFVASALKPALGSVPQFTLAFNMVTLSVLLRTKPLLAAEEPTATEGAADAAEAVTALTDVLIHAPWKGISQIFVVESSLAGAAIVGGIAYYSRGLAAHTLLGSSIGAATGALMGADMASLAMGLYGFNSALTSLGVGVFYVHSPQVMALSAGGAAATAVVFGAMGDLFGAYGSPCLTLPFCLTMSGCYLLADTMPGLKLAEAPHSPERNE
ncbi:Urea transporter [Seminavis robusta]|uniref:Urea transporter n=1 Tax=Seminavis robusta TaxID=568900 RepID=A0A9N8H5L0_9STRA|nr:Urea transporter [Seminavis robusta]|eukprot:Sro25_g017310.1 Urea transporter (384) ;mRNA; f:153124-154275